MILIGGVSFGQKKKIQFETYKEWKTVGNGGLSNDGKFAFYTISNQPLGGSTFVLQSTDTPSNKQEFQGISNAKFSTNSKYLIGIINSDSLFILTLKTNNIQKIPKVISFNLTDFKKNEILAYQISNENKLFIKNLETWREDSFDSISEFKFGNTGNSMLLKRENEKSGKTSELIYANLNTGVLEAIYKGAGISAFIFDNDDKQISWLVNNETGNSIWHYSLNTKLQRKLVDAQSLKILPTYNLSSANFRFSKDGKQIFYSQSLAGSYDPYEPKEDLIIWNYRDSYLRSFYDGNRNIFDVTTIDFLSNVDVQSGKSERLIKERESIVPSTFATDTDSLIVIQSSFGCPEDAETIPSARINYTLFNIVSGKRVIFEKDKICLLQHLTISPNGKFIVYFDPQSNNYISFNIASKERINITEKIDDSFTLYQTANYSTPEDHPVGVIGWIDNGSKILLNGRFDIWSVDPLGNVKPKNITKGIGKANQIVFNIAFNDDKKNIRSSQSMLIYAFNLKNKELGFYNISLTGNEDPKKLSMGSFYSKFIEKVYFGFIPENLIKSPDGKNFLILKQSVSNAPNYYYSKDLTSFKQLSNIQPQKNYNWLTSELHQYKDSCGTIYSGILYKPEDFDPDKKYPILFMYYIELSNLLNSFPSIDLVPSNFNIPYAVSNGYLVFLPDMNSATGNVGEGALTSIVSAVNYLRKFNWIDTSNMGISGHSFGGYETNFIVANTNIFKAAASAAGNSELVSVAYDIWPHSGMSYQEYFRTSAPNMGKTLAEDPAIYLKNSPLLKVNNIATPLLLMHNNNDGAVPMRQTIQLFNALRSLKKPVWWLNYLKEQHGIVDPKNQLDYSIKVMEYFDYYLKGKNEPEWMKEHI